MVKFNKKTIIVVSIILILLFTTIFLFKGKLFLNADVKKIVNNKNMDITFKTDSDVITIDNNKNESLEYQVEETDYDTASSVKQIINERDYYVDAYKKYINIYEERLQNIDSNSEEATYLNRLISRFNNKIEEKISSSNDSLNEVINDKVSLSDNEWNKVENNSVNIDKDNKDRIIFVKTASEDNYAYYQINSKQDFTVQACEISEEYLQYTALTEEERENIGVEPSICVKYDDTEPVEKAGNESYPSKYPENFGTDNFFNTTVENMKNQMTTPFCVAFSSTASLESYLYKKYNKVYKLSERYASYRSTKPFSNGNNLTGNRTNLENGFADMAMAKTLAFYGPVYEDEMPFINSYEAIRLNEIDREPVVDVNDIEYTEPSNTTCTSSKIEKIKSDIMNYGDIQLAIYYDKEYNNNGSYIYQGNEYTNHAVTVIGWDDNYPKENFKEDNRPTSNGAFIIKNSWGAQMEKSINGYFYLSYEDAQACGERVSVQNADFDFSDNKYFYDNGGTIRGLTALCTNKDDVTTCGEVKYQAIKINRKNANEVLTKIKYAVGAPSTSVEFYYASNYSTTSDGGIRITGRKIGEATATKGIHTYELETPISISSTGYVIVKSAGSDLYVQYNYANSTDRNYTYTSGDVLFSINGSSFYDMGEQYYTPMIAAYTDIVESTSNDDTKPKVDISGGGVQKVDNGSVILRCSDNVGVTGYYFGTTNPSVSSMTSTEGLESITSDGLVKTGLGNEKYYFGCRDAAGNYSVDNILMRKFNVNSVVTKIEGDSSVHSNANFESAKTGTYYIRNESTVTLVHRQVKKTGDVFYYYADDYKVPDAGNELLGLSTVFDTRNRTLDYDYLTISDDSSTIYMWYDRKVFDATISSGQNGTVTASTDTEQNNSVTVNGGETKTLKVKYGDKINLTATPSSSYHLDSWSGGYVSGNNTTILGPTVTNNVTISTSFSSQVNYTVTFKNGSVNYGDPVTVSSGNKVSAPSTNPQKEGYTFSHWSLTDGGTAYDFNTAVTSNITLYAVWQINSYTVTFNSKGGSAVSSQTVNHGGKVIKPTNPTKEGYVFSHWSITDGGTAYDFNTAVTSNITLYAIWQQSEITIIDDTYMQLSGGVIYIKMPTGIKSVSKKGLSNNLSGTDGWTLYDKNNSVITSGTALITTGSYIKNGNIEYKIVIYGDIDKDGLITIKDLYQSYLLYKNKASLDNYQILAADYNKDGLTNIKDLYEIYKKMKDK